MKAFSKTIGLGIASALFLGGLTTGAYGLVPTGGSGSVGGSARSVVQIHGTIVCAQCNLNEIRETQPQRNHLYELVHKQGQVVMEVTQVNDPQTPITLALPPRSSVRAPDRVFGQLTAEKIDYMTALTDPSAIDPDLGGMLEEIHTCPGCGHTGARRAVPEES
jgi:hypothetical protein